MAIAEPDGASNGNGVRISNARIYDTLMEVKAQVDILVNQNARGDEIHRDHERRIVGLEHDELRRRASDEQETRTQRERSEFWRWFVPALIAVGLLAVTIVQVVH